MRRVEFQKNIKDLEEIEHSRQPASRRLTAMLILIVAAPLLLIWALVVYFDLTFAHHRALDSNAASAAIIAKMVDKVFVDTIAQLDAHKPLLIRAVNDSDQEEINRELTEMLFAGPSIAGIALYSPEGKGIVHLVIPGRMNHAGLVCPKSPEMDWSGTTWFNDYSKAGKRPAISNMYTDPCEPGIPNAAVMMPLADRGRIVGVLRATFDIPAVKLWFKPLKLPKATKITLIDGRRNIVFDSQLKGKPSTAVIEQAQARLNRLPIIDRATTGKHVSGIYRDRKTNEYIVAAYAPITRSGWGALVYQPLSVIEAPIKTHIWHFSAAIFLVVLLGMIPTKIVRRSYSRERDLSDQLYATLEKEKLLRRDLADSVEDLRLINDIALDLSRGLEMRPLLWGLIRNAAKLLRADAAICFVWQDRHQPIEGLAYNLPKAFADQPIIREALAKLILEPGQPLIFTDIDNLSNEIPGLAKAGIKSGLLVPILTSGNAGAVLGTFSFSSGRRIFSQADLQLAQSVARQAGIAIENTLLHQGTATIAKTLQNSLLPPKTPKFSCFQFGSCYKSATTQALVGGDFFDFFTLDRDRLAVIIGDVAGRGIHAASVTTVAKNTLRAFLSESDNLVDVIYQANNAISKSVRFGRFITAFVGILNRSGDLRYINCGHAPPLMHTPPNRLVSLEGSAMPLGLGTAFTCSGERTCRLRDNSVLLLYTDGLTEARRQKELYGERRLRDWLRSHAQLPTQELPRELCRSIQEFCRGKLTDDLAIVAVKKPAVNSSLQPPVITITNDRSGTAPLSR